MTRTFTYDLAALPVTRDQVVRECGGVTDALAATLDETIDALLDEAAAVVRPRAGYVLTTQCFDTGSTVAEQLAGSSRYAVFLATIGGDFDRWSRAFFETGDPFRGLVADAIGSVVVEATVDRLEAAVRTEAGDGEGVTNRVSPGYCGWDVKGQHRLFALLGEVDLGVHLTDAALMVPLKSVSGVIGIGVGAERREVPCASCPQEGCPTRGRRLA